MIELRRNIERGMRHRWLGPLFIILFCVLVALMFLHAMHDGNGTELGEFCLGITMMLGIVLLIRVRAKAPLALVPVRIGRAPPARRVVLRAPISRTTALSFPPPLRL